MYTHIINRGETHKLVEPLNDMHNYCSISCTSSALHKYYRATHEIFCINVIVVIVIV